MQPVVTWYDVLDVMPGASTQEIQDKYNARASQLRPEFIAGAPSAVIIAASRAQQLLDTARRVLGDPVTRGRYDAAAGIRRSGGLDQEDSFPSEPGWGPEDVDMIPGTRAAELLVACWPSPICWRRIQARRGGSSCPTFGDCSIPCACRSSAG